jgi:hypothetical protein
MFNRSSKTLMPLIVIMFLSGCTHHLIPHPQDVNPERVPEINIRKPVTIENIQTSNEEILIGKTGGHTFNGNLQEWTDKAVDLLTKELEKRGAAVTGNSTKILKLAIMKAKLIQGAWRLNCTLTLKVETGDGYTNEFDVTNLSAGNHSRASGGAITLAVTDLLKDEKILKYLKE